MVTTPPQSNGPILGLPISSNAIFHAITHRAEALNLSTKEGDQEQVETEYQAALAENPIDRKAEIRLGDIALRRSDLESALKHYNRALELQPNDAEAESYLKRSVELEPLTAAAH
jgi:tetratricopeptide (TPR) repeat protein